MGGRGYSLSSSWETAIEGWIRWLRIGGARTATLRLRRGQVRVIARRSGTRHPRELTLAMLVELCDRPDWSNDHRKGVRTSLISFFDWAADQGLTDGNPALPLPRVAASAPNPRPAPDDVWRELLAAAPPRERMMARLAGEAGMRRAEVAICHRRDLLRDVTGWALLVHGKGGRQRVVPITDNLADSIRTFCPAGYLFPGQIDGHISDGHVGVLLSRLMPEGWSMHKLRHRFATRGLAGTGNLIAVQKALGHASVATTQRYTAVANHEVRAVAEAAADRTLWCLKDGPGGDSA